MRGKVVERGSWDGMKARDHFLHAVLGKGCSTTWDNDTTVWGLGKILFYGKLS